MMFDRDEEMRIPLASRPIDPRITNVFLDSCAFDPKYHPEDAASLELYHMYERSELVLHITHSNQKEIDHPNTPDWVKREANTFIFTYKVGLIPEEIHRRKAILGILTGNGDPEQMRADAEHVFEASKYGTYFVTTDGRILKRGNDLRKVCGIAVLKPSELMNIIQSWGG